ncbi:MarR family transcriptional regulator [Pullulanibacillus camelliae]|uniref:MarR family transcriptional regulator n=1 Tax=Pullulanibacillus camelliae TaxID=1707096 RepID=A0A8J2YGP5_9BACL|nr:MarR family transcriptional regulator [Pullulanibacillus camelliae]GGE37302.1 MarR family transcriptional regulator [Pullulanibacillus camelliae]
MDGYEKIKKISSSFRQINHLYFSLLRSNSENSDITVMQFYVLSALAQQPDLSLGELADRLYTGNSTMSGVVDRLVKAGLVTRERSVNDRRLLVMRLTPLGKDKKKEMKKKFLDRLSGLADLPDEKVDQLLEIHQEILDRICIQGDGSKDV